MRVVTNSGTFNIEPQDLLLIALEKNGYIVEYQCRSGYCGACRLKLKQGCVSYPTPPLAYLHKDEILPCCCYVTEDIAIDISHPIDTKNEDFFNQN